MSIDSFSGRCKGWPEAEFFNAAEWKNLARCLETLNDAAASQLRIAPLSHFVCYHAPDRRWRIAGRRRRFSA